MWDLVWIVYGFYSWRVLTSAYFDNVIYRADAFWPWLNRLVPRGALLALYRAAFFYGTSRWIAWTIWAHVDPPLPVRPQLGRAALGAGRAPVAV